MTSMNDPARVRDQYAREQHLETRRSVWQPTDDGRDPVAAAERAVLAATSGREAARVLEVGCGTGEFAARLASALPDSAELVATDQSERFVELTIARGVDARVADVMELPFQDATFDVVAALWMLYHVPDLHQALAEIARVLRPGGTFVATTNGDEHVAGLRRDAGGEALVTAFSSGNGEPALRRQFGEVRREEFITRAVFPDHATAVAYLESMNDGTAWRLPTFEGPREYAGHVTVFTCVK